MLVLIIINRHVNDDRAMAVAPAVGASEPTVERVARGPLGAAVASRCCRLRSCHRCHASSALSRTCLRTAFSAAVHSMLAASSMALLPWQLAVELHYKTQFRELSWFGRYLGAGEIALFMDRLWRAGGFLLAAWAHAEAEA